jgi:hypothetical protein
MLHNHWCTKFSSNIKKLDTKTWMSQKVTGKMSVLNFVVVAILVKGAPMGGGACRGAAPPPKPPKTEIKKNTDFVDIMISKVLHDFLFSRNPPL